MKVMLVKKAMWEIEIDCVDEAEAWAMLDTIDPEFWTESRIAYVKKEEE